MRLDLLVGGCEGIHPAPQLDQAAGFRPAGELTAEVGGVHRPGEEHGGVEDGFIANEFEQAGEVHASMLTRTAS